MSKMSSVSIETLLDITDKVWFPYWNRKSSIHLVSFFRYKINFWGLAIDAKLMLKYFLIQKNCKKHVKQDLRGEI